MLLRLLGLTVAACALLTGCAGPDSKVNQAQELQLQSLHLFAADDSPRFRLYEACTSDSVNCVNVDNAFSRWADQHHVFQRHVGLGSDAFRAVRLPDAANDIVYRVAIDYRPSMLSSYDTPTLGHSGGYVPPVVGYSATISIFDAATGNLLQQIPRRVQKNAEKGKIANPYLISDVYELLGLLEKP